MVADSNATSNRGNLKLDFTVFHNVINNELTSTPQTRHSINPANRSPNLEAPVSTLEDVDKAVAAARKAFKPWSRVPAEKRREALVSFADAISSYREEFARLLVTEQGKPLAQAYAEVDQSAGVFKGISALPLPEEILEDNEERKVVNRYVPIGVCCGIVPWNFPLVLASGKIAAAIYTGNTIIIKPSPFTPYCDLKLGELGTAFFPPGVLQVLSGGDDLGPMLTTHEGIDKISFTGSSATGKRVVASCAPTLKRVTLELGGNDPAIFCEDVDVDAIIPKVAALTFTCSSQICMMMKRIYVHEKIYDYFRDALVKHTAALKVGAGTEPDVFFGPVQNGMQYEKVKELFATIPQEGLTPALGGRVEESTGYFITPTIIDNPPDSARVVTEEPFGPIVPLLKWTDEADVIARANDTKMGLGASVWSRDVDRAARMAAELEAGSVWVNDHFQLAPYAPFGGHKWSGIGMELGPNGLKAYCNSQTFWLNKKVFA